MWVSQLALTNFRNYKRLGLDLQPGVAVFCGRNGQGKSNLLEAVYVLATTKSPRTSAEKELVGWGAGTDPLLAQVVAPFARLEARARSGEGDAHLEILFKGEPPSAERLDQQDGATTMEATGVGRSIKVNSMPTRAAGLLGHLTVVYFAPEDVSLAGGAPSGRRRYLDLANSQVAPLYLRAAQQYNRVLQQRNQVLKQIRERRQPPAALDPWTDQAVRTGAFLLKHRLAMLRTVSERAEIIFRELTGSEGTLRIVYRSTACEVSEGEPTAAGNQLAHAYRERLEQVRQREVEQAVTLVGPHRDDFAFLLDGVDLTTYGSRGQQRLAVLALKLAEAEWMRTETGELPVLLLDDILSELDPQRRQYVLGRVAPADATRDREERRQVWITTTDLSDFSESFLTVAQRYLIDAGSVRHA